MATMTSDPFQRANTQTGMDLKDAFIYLDAAWLFFARDPSAGRLCTSFKYASDTHAHTSSENGVASRILCTLPRLIAPWADQKQKPPLATF